MFLQYQIIKERIYYGERNDLLINEIDYYRNVIKKNNDNNNEIYWCNLFHSTKYIEMENNLYNKIKENLRNFMNIYRKYYFNHNKSCNQLDIIKKLMNIE